MPKSLLMTEVSALHCMSCDCHVGSCELSVYFNFFFIDDSTLENVYNGVVQV